MNILTKTTGLAMEMTLKYIEPGDFVIDATCGNGHDTLILSEAVGSFGNVMAIDVQQEAIRSAQELLYESGKQNVNFVQGNFRNIKELAHENFPGRYPAAIVFNLGYLPGGNKALTTETEDSLEAVKQALDLIKQDGIVTVVLYSGHEEGAREKKAILEMAKNLSSKRYHAVYTNMLNQKKAPPEILWITRKT